MPRQRFEITQEQVKELRGAYRQTRDAGTRTRYQAVLLYTQRYAVDEICQITGCSRNSLMEWCRKYRERGVDGLQDHRGGPHRAKLTQAQISELGAKLHEYTPYNLLGPAAHTASGQHWTVEDVAQAVHRWYGVTWDSRVSYQRLLARCGLSYQRTAKVYQSRRPSAVLDFEADTEKK